MSENMLYPSIDIYKSGTRKDELLLTKDEYECSNYIRRLLSQNGSLTNMEMIEKILNIVVKTKTNKEFVKIFNENMKKK